MIASAHRLLTLVAVPRRRIALGVLLGSLTVLCGVGLMASAGYLIARAAEQPPILALSAAMVAVRAFGLARPLARYAERIATHDLALRALARVRRRVYEHIEPLAPGELGMYRPGDLLSRVVADVDTMQNLHLRGVVPPLVAVVAAAVCVTAAGMVLPAAALVLACGLVVAGVLVPCAVVRLGSWAGSERARARGALTSEIVELLAAAPEIVAYGREEETLRRFAGSERRLQQTVRRGALADGVGDGLRLLVTGVTVAGVLAVSVSAVTAGHLDRVSVAALTLLALASFESIQPLTQVARELPETLAAGGRILELVDRRPAIRDPEHARPAPVGVPAVGLDDVHAGYGAGTVPVLRGASLVIQPGRRIALLGSSGAGKTTVARLLLRFLDPGTGRVMLAGHDLREYRQEDIHSAIAVVGQDDHLFSASIRANVSLARPAAEGAEIELALQRAGLWEWVEHLPSGWDTLVGEAGREVSGGQRQRIGLARALLSQAQILVLDEATAHLDPAGAELMIQDTLDAAGERSVLLITHRPEGLHLMDEVVVLADGRITEVEPPKGVAPQLSY